MLGTGWGSGRILGALGGASWSVGAAQGYKQPRPDTSSLHFHGPVSGEGPAPAPPMPSGSILAEAGSRQPRGAKTSQAHLFPAAGDFLGKSLTLGDTLEPWASYRQEFQPTELLKQTSSPRRRSVITPTQHLRPPRPGPGVLFLPQGRL